MLPYSTLAQGLLTGKFKPDTPITGGRINIPNPPQSDCLNCFDSRLSLGQLSGNNRLTVSLVQLIISLEAHVEVHEGMQGNRLVGFTHTFVDPETPVLWVAVCVAHQIIQNVHAIVNERV